jgi:glycosyltransferase involved in cell wall biosynthesis
VTWLARGADRATRVARADILHSPNFVVPWSMRVPFVVTVFDLSTRRFPDDHPLEWRAYERWLLPSRVRKAAALIAISELTRQEAIRIYGVRSERAVTIHLGVDRRFFLPATPPRPLPAKPVLVFPGAPVRRKNLDVVLEAMANAKPASPLARACLRITGAQADRFPEYVARIARLGLVTRVRWMGQVTSGEMPSLIAGADLCVYPSLYEGFGFPPLEAMAAGTPVVASKAACLPEILGDAALLVDPTSVRDFSLAVESVLSDAEVRGRLVDAGRRHVASFTWNRCAQQTAAVYREVMARSR